MASPLLDHSTLGRLRGVHLPSGTVQFRNVLYATIPDRWEQSKLVSSLAGYYGSDGIYDASEFSVMAPQHSTSIDFEFSLIQQTLPIQHEYRVDEFRCLNLTISIPKLGDSKAPLPVLVL